MDSLIICNLALSMLGIPMIARLDDGSKQAQQCALLFPVIRDRVLRDHTWGFAAAGDELQQLAEESFDPAFPIVCSLPTDFIRVIRLTDYDEYRVNGRKILVKSLPNRLIYVRRIEDASMFDATFAEAMQYLLASEIAMSNTRDASLAQYYRQMYEARLAIARSIDSQENIHVYQNPARKSSFLSARFGGYSGFPPSEAVPLRIIEGTEGKQNG